MSIHYRIALFLCLVIGGMYFVLVIKNTVPAGYRNTPMIPGSKWRVHDIKRPKPEIVTPAASPTLTRKPNKEATILFDGCCPSQWIGTQGVKWLFKEPDNISKLPYIEILPKSGHLKTNAKFRDIYLHLEFRLPVNRNGTAKGYGNSGVYLMDQFEVQFSIEFNNLM